MTRIQTRMQTSVPSGFTLIEVMVSLAIIGLITTLMFSALRVGVDTWERGFARIQDLDQRSRVEMLLRRQLSLASRAEFSGEDGAFVLFAGDGHSLEFVSRYSLFDGTTDARKIDYLAEDGRFTYREHFLFDYQFGEIVDGESRVLADFARVDFRYLSTDRDGRAEWIENWELGAGLPKAVQVRINDDYTVVPLTYFQ
jgi:prepilin-type N-terminal cleavage/methylation domain-containing protein